MTWFQCIALFTAWTAALLTAFEVYAWLLRCAAHFHRPLRLPLEILAYLFIVGVLVLSLCGLDFLPESFRSSADVRFVALQSFLGCELFAVVFFYLRHVPVLRELGYFQSKTRR